MARVPSLSELTTKAGLTTDAAPQHYTPQQVAEFKNLAETYLREQADAAARAEHRHRVNVRLTWMLAAIFGLTLGTGGAYMTQDASAELLRSGARAGENVLQVGAQEGLEVIAELLLAHSLEEESEETPAASAQHSLDTIAEQMGAVQPEPVKETLPQPEKSGTSLPEQAGEVVSDVGNWIGTTAGDVGSFVGGNAYEGGKWVWHHRISRLLAIITGALVGVFKILPGFIRVGRGDVPQWYIDENPNDSRSVATLARHNEEGEEDEKSSA